ncbi:MAG TPA: EAL domain-containing protein [Acidimicrobiales bacterium]|nr:EAL domain-containing protein [Acidimicrobiales bacterium]
MDESGPALQRSARAEGTAAATAVVDREESSAAAPPAVPGGPRVAGLAGAALPRTIVARTGGARTWAFVAVIVVVAVAMRTALDLDGVGGAVTIGALAVVAVTYGLVRAWRTQAARWRGAWLSIGVGLVGAVTAQLLQALHAGGPATVVGAPMVLNLVADVATGAGLMWLVRQRLPERSVDSAAEALFPTVALGFALLSLVIVPDQGWHPARQLAAIVPPLADLALLWLASSLMSLTDRHPVAYRYLVAGLGCLFVCHADYAARVLTGHGATSRLADVIGLLGACLWGSAFAHPSLRVSFDPVPLRSVHPHGIRVAMLVATALVAPTVLSVADALGLGHLPPALTIGSTVLPVLLVLYLLHQVFTHAAAEYRAQHDPLTGICNRLLYEDRLRQGISQAGRNGTCVATMFMDLDRFKEINDSLGHAVGNELLKAVVKRLQACLRERDTLARFGGDEFVFLFSDCGEDDEGIVALAQRILERFDDPFVVGGRPLTVTSSIGIALFPRDGDDVDTLLKHADTAMYQAKTAGRNTFQIFDSGMSARARLRFALEDSLRAAVECEQLAVHYQPKLSVTTGEIVGVEALARWRHPRLGFIPPWAFIPLAEETSLVATLGEWVLEVACRQAKAWIEQGLPPMPVAVNLSPRQFAHQPVVEMVTRVLGRTDLDPSLLELEVTESVIMERVDEVVASLNELRALGVRCSIGDFGTGYSALTYLAEMPIDGIKIDRAFVQRIDDEANGAPIVGAVIALAHSLELMVVAEGVETDAQLAFLEAHGCDHVQGFRFSPPLAEADLVELLRTPASVFTDKNFGRVAVAEPISGISPERLEALLESVMKEHRPTELDSEAIEAVLAALQADGLAEVSRLRLARNRSGKALSGLIAGLAGSAPGEAEPALEAGVAPPLGLDGLSAG